MDSKDAMQKGHAKITIHAIELDTTDIPKSPCMSINIEASEATQKQGDSDPDSDGDSDESSSTNSTESTYHQIMTPQEVWLSKYKFTLFEALGRLIQDRNVLARSKSGNEIIIGKNFHIENKDSADLPHLYHYWCLVCTTGALLKDHGAGVPNDEIPRGFLEARMGGKFALSLAHFSRMRRTGADSPWLKFSSKQLLRLLPSVIPTLDSGIPAACEMREGHCCIPGACEKYDQDLMQLLGGFENCMKAVTTCRQHVESGRPQECRKVLSKVEGGMMNSMDKIRCILKTNPSSQSPIDHSNNETEVDESRKDQTPNPNENPSREEPDWGQRYRAYRDKMSQILCFEYHLFVVVCASRKEKYGDIRAPRGFYRLWGRPELQKQLHIEHWKLSVNQRRADMLARGGFAPPLLHNYIFSLLNQWAASHPAMVKDHQLHPGYRQAGAQRRKMSNAITNQIIAYLAMHLSTTSSYLHGKLLEPIELYSDWAMHIKWDARIALVVSRRQSNSSDTPGLGWNLLGGADSCLWAPIRISG